MALGANIRARSRNCEAWSFTCAKCSVKGHYTTSCSKCSTCGAWGHRDKLSRYCPQGQASTKQPKEHSKVLTTQATDQNHSGYLFDQLCTTSEKDRTTDPTSTAVMEPRPRSNHSKVVRLDHHIFDGQCVARPSKPNPIQLVTMTPLPQDHASFGAPMRDSSKLTSVTMPMVADTECQSMIIPLQSAYAMGIRRQDVIPVKLTMRGAIKEDLGVIGGVVVDITTQNPSGPN